MKGRSWETRFSKRRRPKKPATHLGQEIGFTLQAGGAAPPGSLHNLHGSERRQALQGSLTFSINSQLPKQQKNTAAGAAAKQEEASRKKKGGERRKRR